MLSLKKLNEQLQDLGVQELVAGADLQNRPKGAWLNTTGGSQGSPSAHGERLPLSQPPETAYHGPDDTRPRHLAQGRAASVPFLLFQGHLKIKSVESMKLVPSKEDPPLGQN